VLLVTPPFGNTGKPALPPPELPALPPLEGRGVCEPMGRLYSVEHALATAKSAIVQ
jgi:hypothetical protein